MASIHSSTPSIQSSPQTLADLTPSGATGIALYNTLSRSKEPLRLRNQGEVSLYVCGVTPYDALHIGHARAFLTYDVLRRFFEARGLRVRHIQNVTDIDDKIIVRAREVGLEPLAMAARFHEESLVELERLNVLPAHEYPRVTAHIGPILSMVTKLERAGYAYARGGDVYFDVSRDDDYGKLSGQRVEELNAGARIEPGEVKDDPADFALWKSAKPDEPAWDSDYGAGRPGWHIECSAMALELLGEGFDIHGGARELIFPHHENEIAQAESALGQGRTFATTWWHCGELRVDGAKMSKSLGNFITLSDALGSAPRNVWRLLFLQTHPRSPLDYNADKLEAAKASWSRLHNALAPLHPEGDVRSADGTNAARTQSHAAREFALRFDAALSDDLNTPLALSTVFEAVSAFNRDSDEALGLTARRALEILGFDFAASLDRQIQNDALTPGLIELLIEVRAQARARRDFATGDLIRDRLAQLNIILEDGAEATRWKISQ